MGSKCHHNSLPHVYFTFILDSSLTPSKINFKDEGIKFKGYQPKGKTN